MFSKIDKKVFIISVVVIIILLVVGFAIYRVVNVPAPKVENTAGGTQTEIQVQDNNGDSPQVQVAPTPEITTTPTPTAPKGTLTICVDKCGDGVCQPTDPKCDSANMNCTCLENPQECPQDCK